MDSRLRDAVRESEGADGPGERERRLVLPISTSEGFLELREGLVREP